MMVTRYHTNKLQRLPSDLEGIVNYILLYFTSVGSRVSLHEKNASKLFFGLLNAFPRSMEL